MFLYDYDSPSTWKRGVEFGIRLLYTLALALVGIALIMWLVGKAFGFNWETNAQYAIALMAFFGAVWLGAMVYGYPYPREKILRLAG